MESDVPPRCAARFRPRKRLAAGGFGTVWHAIQSDLDRPVALKVLNREAVADPDTLARFESEARLTAGLRHENIVIVIDHGIEDGVPWIAYEFVPGHTLRDEMAGRPMRLGRALRFVAQVAAALEEAHRHGVLHRDIKPENLLVPRGDELKVADFGLAHRANEAHRTSAGLIVGTPGYIAPERIRGAPASPAGDVYACGVLLYELLTGAPPLEAASPLALLERQLKEDPPAPSTRAPVPPDVDRLVMATLAREPARRTPSAQALREALERLAGVDAPEASGEASHSAYSPTARVRQPATLVARRPSLVTPTGKGAPLALTLAALVVVGLCVGWRSRAPAPPRPTAAAPVASPWADPLWKAQEADLEQLFRAREARVIHWLRPAESPADIERVATERFQSYRRDVAGDLRTLDALSARIQQLGEGSGGHPLGRVLEARIACWRFVLEHGRDINERIGREIASQNIQTPADYALFLASLEGVKLQAALIARLNSGLEKMADAVALVAGQASEAGEQLPRLYEDLAWLSRWVHQSGHAVSTDKAVEKMAFDVTWKLERMTGAVHGPAGRSAKGFWLWPKLGSRSTEGRRSLVETLEAMGALARVAPRAKPGLDALSQRARDELADHDRARTRTNAH